jgi:hypothetical protein
MCWWRYSLLWLLQASSGSWRQLVSYRRSERAYVTLSHYSDRGVPALQLNLDGRVAMVTVRVKNFGNTPATITRVSLRVSRDRLPGRPRYGPPDDTGFFLVQGDHFDVTPSLAISPEASSESWTARPFGCWDMSIIGTPFVGAIGPATRGDTTRIRRVGRTT